MKARILFASFLCMLLASSLSFADSQAGAFTLTLGGGYIFFTPKRDLHNTPVTSAALVYNFTGRWAMQFAANLINADSGDPSKHHVHGFAYIWDAMYRTCSFHGIDPYVMAGFNVMSLKPISSQQVNQGGMNVGVGTQFFKSRGIALSLEARDLYTFTGGKNDILLNGGVNFILE